MLAVAVELDIHVIAVEKRVFVACLDAAADAEVLGEGQNVESVSVAYRFEVSICQSIPCRHDLWQQSGEAAEILLLITDARLGITRIFFFGGVLGVFPPLRFVPLCKALVLAIIH